MSYAAAKAKLKEYRDRQVESLRGKKTPSWFLSLWGDVASMLETFASDEENKAVAADYATGTVGVRAAEHLKLDYVCALRREIRKQFVSGEDTLGTDVTPFRLGVISANGARLFDSALDDVLKHAEKGGS